MLADDLRELGCSLVGGIFVLQIYIAAASLGFQRDWLGTSGLLCGVLALDKSERLRDFPTIPFCARAELELEPSVAIFPTSRGRLLQ